MNISVNSLVPFRQNLSITKSENKVSITPKSLNNNELTAYPCNYYFPVSFGKKLSNEEIVNKIGTENFPSKNMAQFYAENTVTSLYEAHLNYYSKLLDCKTLEEAKEKYPEFKDVIDAKDIDFDKVHKISILHKILRGETEGADINNLSIELLKKYYGKLQGITDKENYYGLSKETVNRLFSQLNIKKFSDTYLRNLKSSNPVVRENIGKALKEFNQTEEGKQRIRQKGEKISKTLVKYYQTEEGKKKVTEVSKKIREFNQTEEGRKKLEQRGKRRHEFNQTEEGQKVIANVINKLIEFYKTEEGQKVIEEAVRKKQEFYQTEEGRQKIEEYSKKTSQSLSELYQTPEGKINSLARKLAWYFNPSERNIMSEISKNFFNFPELINKNRMGTITEKEKIKILSYFRNCKEAMPGYNKEIIGPLSSLIKQELSEKIQKIKNNTADDNDLTIISCYYLLTKAEAAEKYLDCFFEVEDKILENKKTYNEAVNIMTDYYNNLSKQYSEEIVGKYFGKLKKVLENELRIIK